MNNFSVYVLVYIFGGCFVSHEYLARGRITRSCILGFYSCIFNSIMWGGCR